MRIYVIGSEGQVARSLCEIASLDETIVFGHSERSDLDLLRPVSIDKALADFRPDIVINPAAYTAVDKAETEPDLAFAINRDGARAVAAAAAAQGATIVHLSTDFVFDGKKSSAYLESDLPNPLNVYGRSKLEGELAVAEANPQHIVLRTSWVYSPFGSNFVRTMLRLAAERDRLKVVDDQVGCPTYAPDIAAAILDVTRLVSASGWKSAYAGVTHLAGPDATTWCAFARAVINGSAARGGRLVPVDPIPTSDYPTPAQRPANSRLSTAKLQSLFNVSLPSMKRSLSNCLDRLLRQ